MKKIMKVIGLIGKSNNGKTSALKHLILKMLEIDGIKLVYASRYLSADPSELSENIKVHWHTPSGAVSDISVILEYKGKIICITSFGDAPQYDIIPKLDRAIRQFGRCDIFVCGRHKINDLKVEFEAYKPIETDWVSKNSTNDPNKYDACNKCDADKLFSIVERSL